MTFPGSGDVVRVDQCVGGDAIAVPLEHGCMDVHARAR